MNNKTIEQNSGIEYVTVNEGMDLWIINYDENKAEWRSDDVEWMKKQGIEINDLGLDSIYSYLEDQYYDIDDDAPSETEVTFKKRCFINLKRD